MSMVIQKRVRSADIRRWSVMLIATGTAFSLLLLLASTAGGERTNPELRISSQGRRGVSPPAAIATDETVAQKKNPKTFKKPSGSVSGVPSAIPPQSKPSWTGKPLFVNPTNSAAQYLVSNPTANGSAYIARMSKTPVAQWFGDWNQDILNETKQYVASAAANGSMPVLVLYNIPNRDCGGYSVGGAQGTASYTDWIQKAAAGIGNSPAVIVLEPDALGALSCLSSTQQAERTQTLAQAVTILKSRTQAAVYLDAGTPVWQPADVMAKSLTAANIAAADGFSLNVSYFSTTALNYAYGDKLSSLIGYKHYIIDTSRNGGGQEVTNMQCNPSFAALGEAPTTNTGSSLSDALLWIKIPWESDGECNGSPGPGEPYWDYAIQLAQNAGW